MFSFSNKTDGRKGPPVNRIINIAAGIPKRIMVRIRARKYKAVLSHPFFIAGLPMCIVQISAIIKNWPIFCILTAALCKWQRYNKIILTVDQVTVKYINHVMNVLATILTCFLSLKLRVRTEKVTSHGKVLRTL